MSVLSLHAPLLNTFIGLKHHKWIDKASYRVRTIWRAITTPAPAFQWFIGAAPWSLLLGIEVSILLHPSLFSDTCTCFGLNAHDWIGISAATNALLVSIMTLVGVYGANLDPHYRAQHRK